jgi:polyhydroxyalkanoate synthesis regulator phasin
MDDRLKSLLYMGIGLASTSQKAKMLLDKMEIEGKLSEEEGKRIITEFIEGVKREGAHLQDSAYRYLHEVLNELETPSKKEFYALQARVEKLEQLLKEKNHDI